MAAEPGRLDWTRDGRGWPHHEASRFVDAAGLRWHVQQMGAPELHAPALLLIHGTGASMHSWRALMPLLARQCRVVAADLPGHGFTSMPADVQTMSLPGMSGALAALLGRLGIAPRIVVGHSAGAAVAARMCLDGLIAPQALVSLNGALLPLGGAAWHLFSPLAKLLAINPLVPRFFAWRANDPTAVRRLVDGTGSVLDAEGLALYARLVRSPGHVAGALAMMANWDLTALARDLPRLRTPLLMVCGGNDRTLPLSLAQRVVAMVPAARLQVLPGRGHLAHEECPAEVAAIVLDWARQCGVSAALDQPRTTVSP